jgi:hypothetical protein
VGNIKIYLRGIWLGGASGMHVSCDRDKWPAVVKAVMNLQVP